MVNMWETRYRLRFRLRSFPLMFMYGIFSLLLIATVIGIVFLMPIWAHYVLNNIEIEEDIRHRVVLK